MHAEILTIGDELLIGQIVNTNAAWLGESLSQHGVDVLRMTTLGDDLEAIQGALAAAFARAELVLVTGGLGPTHDDVTKVAVAHYYGVDLQFDEATFASIRARFEVRGRTMPTSNRTQAMVPEGFTALPNPVGTAPGLWRADRREGRNQVLVVLPGVPFEMKRLMRDEVLPRLSALGGLRTIRHRTLLTTGIGESHLAETLGDLSPHLSSTLRLAFLPSTSGVRLRLSASGDDLADVEAQLDRLEAHVRKRAGRYIFGEGTDLLEAAVGRMLKAAGLTVAVAESCTGGLVQHRLTNVGGASAYVMGGVVAYSNAVKVHSLGVDPKALEQYGAVSEAVVRQMAQGVRERLGADVGISTSGIMGPTGGTPEKPVGFVWIGYADAHGTHATSVQFAHDRDINKALTSTVALNMIRVQLMRRQRRS